MPLVEDLLGSASRGRALSLLLGLACAGAAACGSNGHASDRAQAGAAGTGAGMSGNSNDVDASAAVAGEGGAGGAEPVPAVPPSAVLGNLRDRGVTHSGFLVGTAVAGTEPLGSVEVSLDDGPFVAAKGTTSWTFQLPIGKDTWREGTLHTIGVRAKDAHGLPAEATTTSVRKGTNHDVNGDGYADLAARNSYVSLNRGEAYVFLSAGAKGIQSADAADASTILGAATPSFGWGVTLGDINGDGYADAVVGAHEVNAFAGAAYVFYSTGPAGIPSAEDTDAAAVLSGTAASHQFGASLAVADVNGDGFGDVVVGAAGDGGGAYVFHSSGSSGIKSATDIQADAGVQDNLGDLGWAVAAGDLNGDGYADVVAGNPNHGIVFVLYSAGKSGIPPNVFSTVLGTGTQSGFGLGLAIADVNGDGYGDLIATALGHACLFYSAGKSGLTAADDMAADSTITESMSSSYLSVAAGDINGDGYADIVIGNQSAGTNLGQAELFYSAGSQGIASADDTHASATLLGTAAGSQFGFGVALGDFDGDGYADVAAGAEQPDRAYVFPSRGDAGVPSGHDTDAAATITAAHGDFGSVIVELEPAHKYDECSVETG